MHERLHSVQILRALACAFVILSHAAGRTYRTDVIQKPDIFLSHPNIVTFGHFGVDLFFVISGFIMYLVHHRDFGLNGAPLKFLKSRLVRVVPIYWILSFVALIILFFMPTLFSYREEIEAHWVLGSFLFFPTETSYGLKSPILGVGWSLNYEVFFYLVFSLCLFFRKSVGITFIIFLFSLLVYFGDSWQEKHTSSIYTLLTSPLLIEFVLGLIVGFVYVEYRVLYSKLRWYLLVIGAAIIISSLGHIPDSYGSRLLAWGVPSAAILLSLCLFDQDSFNKPWLQPVIIFGDASYSAYLIQVFSLPFFSLVFIKFFPYYLIGFWTYVLFLFVCTCFVSFLFWKFVEKRLTRYLRQAF